MREVKNIAVLTGTRADFGLLSPLIERIDSSPKANLQLIATGTHLSSKHGWTVNEIYDSGHRPTLEIPIWSDVDSEAAAAVDFGQAVEKFSQGIGELNPDCVILLGDRLEALAMSIACMISKTPLLHIAGGDLTLGAMDDSIRHAVTKLAYLHFTTNENSYRRVLQMGESADRVFNFGSPLLDSLNNMRELSRKDLTNKFGLSFGEKTAIFTFHPAAFESTDVKVILKESFDALKQIPKLNVIFTGTNNDINSSAIKELINIYVSENPYTAFRIESLGQLGYISAIKHADFVIGNSSSTVLEAPLVGIPSILLGDRQDGRELLSSVIKPKIAAHEIKNAIELVLSPAFKLAAKNVSHPYGVPGFADKVLQEILSRDFHKPCIKIFSEFR